MRGLLNFEVSKSTEDTFPVANSTLCIIQQAIRTPAQWKSTVLLHKSCVVTSELAEYVKQMCAEIDVLYYE